MVHFEVESTLAMLQTIAVIVAIISWLISRSVFIQASNDVSIFDWIALACTGVIYYGLAYWLYLKGLQRVPASIAGLYLNLLPVFTISLAFLLLGKFLTNVQWIGAIIVLAAVFGISLMVIRDERSSVQMQQHL